MFEGINKWLRRGKKGSKTEGKRRLQLILIHDRTGISPEILDALTEDMFSVISRYFVVNQGDVKMDIERDEDSVALVANIPILSMKRQPISSR